MRSIVNVEIVPSTSDIGTASWSPGFGGVWISPSASFEPTNAYFHSVRRPAAAAEMRDGSGRRGPSTLTQSRHDRYLTYATGPDDAICVAIVRAGFHFLSATGVW